MRRSAGDTSAPSSAEAQALAGAIRRLEGAVAGVRWGTDSVANADLVYGLPEYGELLGLAYASGFVRGELSADGFGFDAINARPQEQLGDLPYSEVCRYVHALCRCERHSWGWGSLVLMATQSGALGVVADRLGGPDQRLPSALSAR